MGVFTDEKSTCGGNINPTVVWVGEGDTRGPNGSWILRIRVKIME